MQECPISGWFLGYTPSGPLRQINYEIGLAAHLRVSRSPTGLLELYDRFTSSGAEFDATMRRVVWWAPVRKMGHGARIGQGVRFSHLETFELPCGCGCREVRSPPLLCRAPPSHLCASGTVRTIKLFNRFWHTSNRYQHYTHGSQEEWSVCIGEEFLLAV